MRASGSNEGLLVEWMPGAGASKSGFVLLCFSSAPPAFFLPFTAATFCSTTCAYLVCSKLNQIEMIKNQGAFTRHLLLANTYSIHSVHSLSPHPIYIVPKLGVRRRPLALVLSPLSLLLPPLLLPPPPPTASGIAASRIIKQSTESNALVDSASAWLTRGFVA